MNPRRRRRLRLQRDTARDLGTSVRDERGRLGVIAIERWRAECDESYRAFKAECECLPPIVLSQEEWERFQDRLDDPAEPTQALRDLMRGMARVRP